MHEFATTETKRQLTSPGLERRAESPEGPGRTGNKPLMRNRKAPRLAVPIGSHPGESFATWIPCAVELPDADRTVLVNCPHETEPVWLGFLDENTWRSVEGDKIEVTHWMDLPAPAPAYLSTK